MKTVGDPRALDALQARVERLAPDTGRRWGKMNVQQMLSHLAVAMEWVTGEGEARPWPRKPSKLIKFVALRVPVPWPKGIPNPNDPAGVPVAPEEFDALRKRVLAGLAAMSRWEPNERTPPHPAFGPMTTWEWRRWAWKHADHHLRQFGA